MADDDNKTPRQLAEKQVNQQIGKSIANRLLAKKRLEAELKKIDREIAKLESGELVTSADEESALCSQVSRVISEVWEMIHPRPKVIPSPLFLEKKRTFYDTPSGTMVLPYGAFTVPAGQTFAIRNVSISTTAGANCQVALTTTTAAGGTVNTIY